MKNLILGMLLLVATSATAQNSLFENISTTDTYDEYWSIQDPEGDGNYLISEQRFVVKFETKHLPTGEGHALTVTVVEGSSEGHVMFNPDVVERDYLCEGYPYESVLTHKYEKDGFVAIGDYIFKIRNVSKDGTSFDGIDNVFIKRTATTADGEPAKKKKLSFKDIANAVKDNYTGSSSAPSYGAAHKALESKNLNKMITDYLVAMKAKQDARTATEKQKDKNITDAKALYDSDLDAYNEKIKASPEYIKMKEHQKRMEQMDNKNAQQLVTIYNKTGKDIYIYADGNRQGYLIRSNSSRKTECDSNYTYKFDSNTQGSGTSFYSANSSCNGSFTVR